jgi:DNA-binding transcriptional regulator of glucitol operon
VVLDSPYAIGIIFVTLALMWVLQMYLAKKQANSFLNAVNSIKGSDLEVAIGVNQPKWGRKKIYIAVSANAESIIVDGLTLEGVTTFAKSKKLTLFNGMSLHEIVTSDKNEPIWEAASMASDTLIKRIESKKDSNSIS